MNGSGKGQGRPRITDETRAEAVRRWSTEPGLTREQLAFELGISYNSLRGIVKGVEKAQSQPAAGGDV